MLQRLELCVDAETSARYALAVFTRGDVIRKWREQKNWTAAKLAREAKVDKNTITRAEANLDTMREESIARIVRALGQTMGALYTAVAMYGDGAELPAPLVSLIDVARKLQAVDQAALAETAHDLLVAERMTKSHDAPSGASTRGKRAAGDTNRR